MREHVAAGLVRFAFRHRVDELVVEDGAVVGVRGAVLEPSQRRAGHGRAAAVETWASSSSGRRP